jgi:hypothetical protein
VGDSLVVAGHHKISNEETVRILKGGAE